MSENVDRIPLWQRAIRRTYDTCLRYRFPDPIQRQAQAHLHDDLAFVDERVSSFAAAPISVQLQVIRELEHKVEFHKPGNTSPALTGLVGVVGTTMTLIGAIYLAVYNGWFGLLSALTDPETGQVHGITTAQSNSVVGGITPAILSFGVAFLAIGLLAFAAARSRDKVRATSRIWLRVYKNATSGR